MSVQPHARKYYVAMNNDQFDGLRSCGRCVEVQCDDHRCSGERKKAVVQVLDRCPECKHGDLDLSPEVFREITGSHPSRYTVKWKYVQCPSEFVSGNIKVCTKDGSNRFWTAFQPTNSLKGIKAMKVNGVKAHLDQSQINAYYFKIQYPGGLNFHEPVHFNMKAMDGSTVQGNVHVQLSSCTEGNFQFGDAAEPPRADPAPLPPATDAPSLDDPVVTPSPPEIPVTDTPSIIPPVSDAPTSNAPISILPTLPAENNASVDVNLTPAAADEGDVKSVQVDHAILLPDNSTIPVAPFTQVREECGRCDTRHKLMVLQPKVLDTGCDSPIECSWKKEVDSNHELHALQIENQLFCAATEDISQIDADPSSLAIYGCAPIKEASFGEPSSALRSSVQISLIGLVFLLHLHI